MKAFVVDRYGNEGRVRFSDVPTPDVGEGDVLVQVHAAGVSPLDSKIRNGEFRLVLPYRSPARRMGRSRGNSEWAGCLNW